MATKQLVVDGIGDVRLYKRKGAKSVRISLDGIGGVRVTLPRWLPYKAGLDFLETKKDWVAQHQKSPQLLTAGQRVGKTHLLDFTTVDSIKKPNVRLVNNTITVKLPRDISSQSHDAQLAAKRGAVRALKLQADQLLTQRIKTLAQTHGFEYKSAKTRPMKSRWGSCNQSKEIVLNVYLMQLPWELIDYVILHELTHTRVMAHGRPFWDEMNKYVADVQSLRKQIKNYRAQIS